MSAKVASLADVSRAVSLEPLEPDDARYANLAAARGTRDLKKLKVYLESIAPTDHCASVAFVGHRGSGKSTELKRLEGELAELKLFTPLHLEIDNTLQLDCDYTDLLLWLVDSLVNHFADQHLSLDPAKAAAVADWFADHTVESASSLKSEIGIETSAETSAKTGVNLGIFSYSVKLLARLKARVVGNQEHRTLARRKLQNYSDELLQRVNDLLVHAREVLHAHGRPARLLVVQDNLDRLRPDAALRLFRDNGDFLKQIKADCIWTAPINSRLAPFGIHTLFSHVFSMPTIKVHDKADRTVDPGIDGLVHLVALRIDLDAVFASRAVVAYLAAKSGGSVRDLLRLIGEAQLAALVDGEAKITQASAEDAVKKLRLDFQGLFVPGDAYYPLLVSVARTKQDAVTTASATPEQAENNRRFFAELLVNGSILEYNGDERWFDVHPVVRDIAAFTHAYQAAAPKARPRKKA